MGIGAVKQKYTGLHCTYFGYTFVQTLDKLTRMDGAAKRKRLSQSVAGCLRTHRGRGCPDRPVGS